MTTNPIELITFALQYAQDKGTLILNNQNLTAVAYEIYDSLKVGNVTDAGYKMVEVAKNVNTTALVETGKELLANGQSALVTAQDFINQELQDENSYAKPLLFAAVAVTGVALTGLAIYSCMRRRHADPVVVSSELTQTAAAASDAALAAASNTAPAAASDAAPAAASDAAPAATRTVNIQPDLLYKAFVSANPILGVKWLSGKTDEVKSTIHKMNPWFDQKGNIQLVEVDGETHVVKLAVSKEAPVYTIPVKDILNMPALVKAGLQEQLKAVFEATPSQRAGLLARMWTQK